MPFIHGKSLGHRRPLFDDFRVPVTSASDEPQSVRELISQIVREQVHKFEDRQQQGQFLRVLTEKEISAGVDRGKIDSGKSDVPLQPVDVDAAIETALVAFQDGLYLVVIDDVQVQSLDERRSLKPESHITFVRLTLLAGG
ncbi:hypothetical protein [Schlesneria paludicola]|uniref:hypothetical protein n=1 Tax=Schlesneria paludicola TaxID=360056 RepID=UPI00029AB061|nr:hypothetical protein [Schlesneria paludicola]